MIGCSSATRERVIGRNHLCPVFQPRYERQTKVRKPDVNFGGEAVGSDGGLLLVREVSRPLRLTERAAAVPKDPRHPDLTVHTQLSMLRQRVYAMVQGYEDLNDHGLLRDDILLQSWSTRARACRGSSKTNSTPALSAASSPTAFCG